MRKTNHNHKGYRRIGPFYVESVVKIQRANYPINIIFNIIPLLRRIVSVTVWHFLSELLLLLYHRIVVEVMCFFFLSDLYFLCGRF